MTKSDYLQRLQQALGDLAPETIAKTLAYYEQRFIDGQATGMSEEQVAASLDEPKKIAMTLRANIHMQSFAQRRNPAALLRMLVSALGLLFFNLFMVLPALVYAALLATVFAAGLAFYVAGIAITASGLAGANELVLEAPFHELIHWDEQDQHGAKLLQTRIAISEGGIHIDQEPRVSSGHQEAAGAAGAAAAIEADGHDDPAAERATPNGAGAVIKRAEAFADSGVHISTDLDEDARSTQIMAGIGLVVGGILAFLLGLFIAKHTFIGIKRYVGMNISLIKGS